MSMVTLLTAVLDGSFSAYFLVWCIGMISFPFVGFLLFGLIYLIAKILDYLRYLKKRKEVFDRLYPQYKALMKGEKDE